MRDLLSNHFHLCHFCFSRVCSDIAFYLPCLKCRTISVITRACAMPPVHNDSCFSVDSRLAADANGTLPLCVCKAFFCSVFCNATPHLPVASNPTAGKKNVSSGKGASEISLLSRHPTPVNLFSEAIGWFLIGWSLAVA